MNKGALVYLALILVVSAGVIEGEDHLHDRQTGPLNSLEKIERAYQEREIDYETALQYKVYTIRELQNLPERFRSEAPLPYCGTSILLKAWRESAPGILHVRDTLSGPENILDTSHFRIHWTNSGADSTDSVYVDSIATFAEFCWEQEVDTLGWNSPPSDTFNHSQPESIGGDFRYDIYVIDLGPGLLGYVQAEHTVPPTPEEDATSYMVLDNDMTNSQLQTTIAHEFNHSCQFGYSFNENTSWYENSAVWMEDQVYDAVNSYYGFLSNTIVNPITFPEVRVTFFTSSDTTPPDSNFYAYGGCTWPMYLHQNNGTPVIIRDIWALQGLHLGNFTMADIDSILRLDYSSDIDTAYREYAVWRYFAGPNDDGAHFEEGGAWGAIP